LFLRYTQITSQPDSSKKSIPGFQSIEDDAGLLMGKWDREAINLLELFERLAS